MQKFPRHLHSYMNSSTFFPGLSLPRDFTKTARRHRQALALGTRDTASQRAMTSSQHMGPTQTLSSKPNPGSHAVRSECPLLCSVLLSQLSLPAVQYIYLHTHLKMPSKALLPRGSFPAALLDKKEENSAGRRESCVTPTCQNV